MKKKRLLGILLSLVLMLTMMPALSLTAFATDVASGNCGSQGESDSSVTWSLSDKGVLTINGTGAIMSGQPWGAYRDQIFSLVVREGITEIGERNFSGYSEMARVSLPSTLTKIGNEAFYRCNGVANIKVPDSVTEIGYRTFYECENVNIPASTQIIGEYAYSDTQIEMAVIPAGLSSIPDHAFWDCNHLKTVTFNEGVTSIGNQAFEYCPISEVSFPDTLTSIGANAFTGLTSVHLGKNISSVKKDSFSHNYSGSYGGNGLKSISVDDENANYKSFDGVLYNKDLTRLVIYPSNREDSSLTVPGTVETITGISSNNLTDIFMSAATAPSVGANSISLGKEGAIIHVPSDAAGYDVKPWINYTVKYDQPTEAITSVSLNKTDYTFESADPLILTATVDPAMTNAVFYIWSSSNEDVAKVEVTEAGKASVTPYIQGTSDITLRVGDKISTCCVTVPKNLAA